MVMVIGYVVAFLSALVALELGKGKAIEGKLKVWGIAIMLPISPALSIAIGLTYAVIVQDPWAGLIFWFILPFIFMTGLILLLIGNYL
ncbi:hypothetical protein [Guptibacillus hwajinpoensis]|uniref:hypothetical protein n=1 Tax=Guptibacillus hwajinpoensis TaxID=208199 RepID=UPI003737068C